MKDNEVLIYVPPVYFDETSWETLDDIESMTEQERYVWAKNEPSGLVEIFHTLDYFCTCFNREDISDFGYCFVGKTLI